MVTADIVPFDGTEGLNDEVASLAAVIEMPGQNRQAEGSRQSIDVKSKSGSLGI